MNNRRVEVVWGLNGMRHALAPIVVIVDVLSFSSSVDAACGAGAIVYPYKWRDESVAHFAASVGAEVAVQRQDGGNGQPSLSPVSLTALTSGQRLVLPSPNGSSLTTESVASVTIAGCLRNADMISRRLNQLDDDVTIVAAGERWPDGSLRPALEDLIGAGAIASQTKGTKSEDAMAAQVVFDANAARLGESLLDTPSGRELVTAGFEIDVQFAADLNVSSTVPILGSATGAYQHHSD